MLAFAGSRLAEAAKDPVVDVKNDLSIRQLRTLVHPIWLTRLQCSPTVFSDVMSDFDV